MLRSDYASDAGADHDRNNWVGITLRAERQRSGESLEDVAAVLRIRIAFLQAIEQGRYDQLPGLPYAIGFVRTYAEHLGLDGAEMVRRFKAEAAGLDRKTSLNFPSPAPEGRVPGTPALVISLVAGAVIFGGWWFFQGEIDRFAVRVPEVPERLAGPSAPQATVAIDSLPASSLPTPSLSAPLPAAASVSSPPPAVPPPAVLPTAVLPTAVLPPAIPPLAVPPLAVQLPVAPPAAASPPPVARAPAPPPLLLPPPAPAPAPARAAPVIANDAPLPPPPGDASRRPVLVPPVSAVPPPAERATPEDASTPPPVALGPQAAPLTVQSEEPPPAPPIPAAPQVAALPEGRVFGAQNTDSRVIIRARGESWVQIRDTDNTTLLTRVLRPGDSFRVPNKSGLTMMTGNAGVLEITVDGNPAPAVGDIGAVRRNIALDAERLRAGTAVGQ